MFKILGAGNCGLAFGTYMIREHLDFSANVCFGGRKVVRPGCGISDKAMTPPAP